MRTRKSGHSLLVSLLLILTFHLVSGFLPQPGTRKKKIEILYSDLYTYDAKIVANATRLIGNVKLMHNNVLLYCDSAYEYKDSNMVDAFGHVHIIQGDTLNLYGDRIKYEGNSRIARVKGNVKLVNKSITLTTDELVFDLRANIGNYLTWGKIVDTANVLVSKIGRYYSNEDLFFFKDSVKVTNKDFVLTADTLKYNSKTERVFIVGPTHIVGTSQKGTLYSESGWYDTRTNISELYKSSKIIGKEQSLQGDTIYYSRNSGIGRARSRVILSDTTNHIAITGRKGSYNEKTKIAFVTDSAVFMQYSPKDTLFLHADTLKSIPDLSARGLIKKTVKQQLSAIKTVAEMVVAADSMKGKQDAIAKAKTILKETPQEVIDTIKKAVQAIDKQTFSSPDLMTAVKDTGMAAAKIAASLMKITPFIMDSLKGKQDAIAKAKTILKETPQEVIDTIRKVAQLVNKRTFFSPDSMTSVKDTGKVAGKIAAALMKVNPFKMDSLGNVADTLKAKETKDEKDDRLFMAYHQVRFYKKDLQGICDSLAYQMKDSVMRLYSDPVLWSEVHQLSAERIEFRPHHPDPDIARLENNGFIISREDSIKYNQISGKLLLGYIYNNKLKRIEVNGNAITLYYLKNKDRFSGMNKLESSKINVYLVESKIDSISFFPKPEGKTIPLKDLTTEDATLKGFVWRESEQPKNRFDIYPLDEKRKKIAGPEKKPASKK